MSGPKLRKRSITRTPPGVSTACITAVILELIFQCSSSSPICGRWIRFRDEAQSRIIRGKLGLR